MDRDPLDILSRGDGGGQVWSAIEGRLAADLPPVPLSSRVAERLGLDGTPVEAALRSPPGAFLLGLGAAGCLLTGGLLGGGEAALPLLLAGPLLSGLAGGLSVYTALDPAYELTRVSGQVPLLVVARQLVVWLALGVPLLLVSPWLSPGLLLDWLTPALLTHTLALTLGLPFGTLTGLAGASLVWLWLVAGHTASLLPSSPSLPHFPEVSVQVVLVGLLLLASWNLVSRPPWSHA